ncbi:MAG: DUF4097 family beta strand repeat protein [Acidobacteria bacterium]|nr:DUF4097 family beta strand repeat protein [Acidobacteriota bacterium]
MNRRSRSATRLFVATLGCLALVGCTTELAFSDVDTEQRTFTQSFPDLPGQVLRLANLAGEVELIAGEGEEVVVEAEVHARGRNDAETRRLLDEMTWEEGADSKDRPEWALTYPVDRYKRFHFNGKGWSSVNRVRYRGERVSISSRARSGSPTVFVNLRIHYPGAGGLAVTNVVGDIRGGDLAGVLSLDTGSGAVALGDFSGELSVDTGSGDVRLGVVRGETLVDTGSGDVRVRELIGNGRLDTGSGGIAVAKVAMGRLEADTGSGDILIENGSVGTLKADTGSGGIRILSVDVVSLEADTGSGDVVLDSSLEGAERVNVDTGSGDVRIRTAEAAAFDIELESGSGELVVRYDDAELRRADGEVVGARRGHGGPRITVDTGSGDCVIGPAA